MNIKPAGAASSNAISQNTTNPQAEEDAKSALKDGAISLQEFNTQNNQQQTLDNAVHGSGMQSMTGDVAHGDEVDVTDNVDSGDDEVNLEDDVIDVSDGDIDVTENDEAPSVGFQQIGQREGLDYYRGVEDDVRAQFSNQNTTREYMVEHSEKMAVYSVKPVVMFSTAWVIAQPSTAVQVMTLFR